MGYEPGLERDDELEDEVEADGAAADLEDEDFRRDQVAEVRPLVRP